MSLGYMGIIFLVKRFFVDVLGSFVIRRRLVFGRLGCFVASG